ncbi:hypothetical protein F5Y01DRAFT_325273 [Xylaria sp. FL0043]|nr:hypothetical protein F5Y01DRAFT_325273 [Xylaria sp. FL0043]
MATHEWQPGDIAFLKPAERFSKTERKELIDSGRVREKATGHPVIILGRSNDPRGYVVTTVSAYNSGDHNNYLPPWKQERHKAKDINGFRAFEGSVKPNNNFRHLSLEGGKSWPKPKTSWVFIHFRSTVPASTLIKYDKPKSQLRMTPESLQDLLDQVQAKPKNFRGRGPATNARREPNKPAAKIPQKNWGHDDKEYESRATESYLTCTNMVNRNSQPSPKCNVSQGLGSTGNKPLWSAVVAQSTTTATSTTCKAKKDDLACRNQFAVLA